MIKINASDLDDGFYFRQTEMWEEKNLEWWDILHSVLLNGLLSKEKSKYIFMFYAEDMTKEQREWLRKCMNLSEKLPELLMIEQKKRIQIEYWKYLIILSWKFDWMYVDSDWVKLVDVKTAAKKIDYETKIQLKVYWFMNNIKDIEYWVFTKEKNPELNIHKFELNLEKNKNEVLLKIIQHIEDKYWYLSPKINKSLFFNPL